MAARRGSPRLQLRVPAKVNLILDVGSRQPDGYHALRSVMQAVSLFDELHLAPASGIALRCVGADLPEGPDNLAWQAAHRLREAAGIDAGVRITLRKRIPVRAGLGGGSADAAAVLLGCSRLWRLGWGRGRLRELAASLGSDVPFFLWGGTALATGRGERLRALPPLPPWPIVLAFPVAGVGTAEAYAALDAAGAWPHPDPAAVTRLARSLARSGAAPRGGVREALGRALGNSFEAVVLPRRPDVAALKRQLQAHGALGCVLCGSGAAVWALAPSEPWSRSVAAFLRQQGVWAVAARLWPQGVLIRRGRRH